MMNMDPGKMSNLESKSRDELADMARKMGMSHTDMDKEHLIQMIRQRKQEM